jgi:hypothetical protein
MGIAMTNSMEIPFSYTPVSNPNIHQSAQEASDQAEVLKALSKYSWKQDIGPEKSFDFWHQIYKTSNVPVQVFWNTERRRVKLFDQKTQKAQWKEGETRCYPSWRVLPWSMVYADLYAGPIEKQKCVIVLSIVSWMDIQKATKSKWYDEAQVKKLRTDRSRYVWDGSEGATFREEQVKNAGMDGYSPGASELFLQWDVYQWCPIKGESWDDDGDYTLWWGTAIGNTLESAIPIRLETDFDPDEEIPIFMSNALPDDSDLLYHMSWGETVRPQYAVECTLWELAVDNGNGINHPPLAFDSTKFNMDPEDLQYRAGAKWDIRDPSTSIREFNPRPLINENATLITMIQGEQESAANVNKNMMGEGYGGRQAATENININRLSGQPNASEAAYIAKKFFRWLGRKYKSYWHGFAPQEMIELIADEQLDHPVFVDKLREGNEKFPKGAVLYGDFDVQVDAIDEFVEDFVQIRQELDMLRYVGQSANLQKSQTHKVDFGFWMRDLFRRMKVKNADRIILPSAESDAHLRQREELRAMQDGVQVQPQDGEDHDAHISECDAEILRWKPVLSIRPEDMTGEEAASAAFADVYINQFVMPHREAHKAMQGQAAAQMAAGPGGGTLPAGQNPQTPGQMAGAEPAMALGGQGEM